MRYVNFLAATLLVFSSGVGVQAQTQEVAESKSPDQASTLALDLSTVAIFKASASEDGKVVVSKAGQNPVAQTGFRTEVRTRVVPVTKTRTETRTRKSTDNKAPKTYTVQVPYTEMVTQSYTVLVPISAKSNKEGSIIGSRQRKTEARFVEFDSMTAWDLNGKLIPKDQLKSRLEKPCTAFLIKQPLGPNVKINSAYRAVLRDDVMLIQVARKN